MTSSLLPDDENSLLGKFHDLIENAFLSKGGGCISKDERLNSKINIFSTSL